MSSTNIQIDEERSDGGVDKTTINVASIDSDPPPPPPPPTDPVVRPNQLAEVDDVITFTSEQGGIVGTFHVQNLTGGTIIIKVKTTAPDKYRVRPTIGLIEGGLRAPIKIFVHDGVPIYTLPHDRFQVQVCVVPPGFQLESDLETDSAGASHNLNFGDLQAQWKNITQRRDAYLETHRLSCQVDPGINRSRAQPSPEPTIGETGPVLTITEDDMRRGLSQMEQRMTTTMMTKVDERFNWLEYLIYVIFLFVGLVGLILYFCMPSTARLPENYCTMSEHNRPLLGTIVSDQEKNCDQKNTPSGCTEL